MTTPGRRVPDDASIGDLQPGDYRLDGARRALWVCLPNGLFARIDVAEGPTPASERVWGFTEHADGTITVTPSIWSRGEGEWHGFLERGVWREV